MIEAHTTYDCRAYQMMSGGCISVLLAGTVPRQSPPCSQTPSRAPSRMRGMTLTKVCNRSFAAAECHCFGLKRRRAWLTLGVLPCRFLRHGGGQQQQEWAGASFSMCPRDWPRLCASLACLRYKEIRQRRAGAQRTTAHGQGADIRTRLSCSRRRRRLSVTALNRTERQSDSARPATRSSLTGTQTSWPVHLEILLGTMVRPLLALAFVAHCAANNLQCRRARLRRVVGYARHPIRSNS